MTMIAQTKAEAVLKLCRENKLMLATVESCTGGLIIASLTDIAGSSDVVDCGFITYSNSAKTSLVGVPAALIETYGAVSQQVAIAMAEGGLKHSNAQISVAVTGIAGPGGGSADKPVGMVHMAVAYKNHKTYHHVECFSDLGRDEIRHRTVNRALDLIGETLNLKINNHTPK